MKSFSQVLCIVHYAESIFLLSMPNSSLYPCLSQHDVFSATRSCVVFPLIKLYTDIQQFITRPDTASQLSSSYPPSPPSSSAPTSPSSSPTCPSTTASAPAAPAQPSARKQSSTQTCGRASARSTSGDLRCAGGASPRCAPLSGYIWAGGAYNAFQAAVRRLLVRSCTPWGCLRYCAGA